MLQSRLLLIKVAKDVSQRLIVRVGQVVASAASSANSSIALELFVTVVCEAVFMVLLWLLLARFLIGLGAINLTMLGMGSVGLLITIIVFCGTESSDLREGIVKASLDK